MTPVISLRERWVALGLLLAALLLAYGLLVHPWWTVPMQELQARIAQLQERDARLRAQLAQAPLVQARLQDARMRLASRPGFLAESTPELATASLVQRLETVVAQASPGNRSCAISNRSPLPGAGEETYARVVVQVRLRCGTPELATVLHALEAGTPRMFVENLSVLAQRFFFPSGGGDPSTREGGLDVSFDLVGYLRPAGLENESGGPAAFAGVMPVQPLPGPAPATTTMPEAPTPSPTAPPVAIGPATVPAPAMEPPVPVPAPGPVEPTTLPVPKGAATEPAGGTNAP